MRELTMVLFLGAASFVSLTAINAQPPGGDKGDKGRGERKEGTRPSADEFVQRMMALDKNGDGKIQKDEVTDERMQRMFERADTNKDGVVTKEELQELAKTYAQDGNRRPGGPGGPGGFGGPQPGQILPTFLQQALKLTDDQKKQLEALQTETDTKLNKILTEEQAKQLKEMRTRGPGGFPGRPGAGGDQPRRPEGNPGTRPAPQKD